MLTSKFVFFNITTVMNMFHEYITKKFLGFFSVKAYRKKHLIIQWAILGVCGLCIQLLCAKVKRSWMANVHASLFIIKHNFISIVYANSTSSVLNKLTTCWQCDLKKQELSLAASLHYANATFPSRLKCEIVIPIFFFSLFFFFLNCHQRLSHQASQWVHRFVF